MKTLRITAAVFVIAAFAAQAQQVPRVVRPVRTTRVQVWGGQMSVTINSIEHTVPFTTANITVLKYANGAPLPAPVTKTVWLKNLPARTVRAFDTMKALNAEKARLDDEKLQVNKAMSDYNYNQLAFAHNAKVYQNDHDLSLAQAELKQVQHDRAMPIGQIYGGKEIWDMTLRPGEVPRL